MMMTIIIIIEITIRERVILLIIWTWKKKSYIISNHSFSIASYFTNRTKVFDKITTKIHTQVISFTCTWKASTNEYVSKWKGNSRDLDSDVHVENEKILLRTFSSVYNQTAPVSFIITHFSRKTAHLFGTFTLLQ